MGPRGLSAGPLALWVKFRKASLRLLFSGVAVKGMKFMSAKPIGLYVHVPFCDGKCPYCDFYSLRGTPEMMDAYTLRAQETITDMGAKLGRQADTLYLGGGTPSLLGAERLARLIAAAKAAFGLKNAEITVEVNPGGAVPARPRPGVRPSGSSGSSLPGQDGDAPGGNLREFFGKLKQAGANRLSIGLQSADDEELRLLGRRHTAADAARAVRDAQDAGFDNISLDLMLAVRGQTRESLARSMDFCAGLGVRHVSAYLLQLEPGTAYWKNRAALRRPGPGCLPDEEAAAALYLAACRGLRERRYVQYEISNFAEPGYESRHNLKYWNCEEYLGVGPSAHSFINGERFHQERGVAAFLRGEGTVSDGPGGGFEEYAMLRLRLASGLTDAECLARFGRLIPERMKKAARRYEARRLTVCTEDGFHFTPEGFLLSDALTAEILFAE